MRARHWLLAATSPLLFAAGCTRTADAPESAVLSETQSTGGMVVSASALASQAGRDVLAAGGNAIDAAIATGFALAVTYPTAGNIGGGGFMVVRFPDGRTTTIDFREMAPAAANPMMFTDSTGEYSVHHPPRLARDAWGCRAPWRGSRWRTRSTARSRGPTCSRRPSAWPTRDSRCRPASPPRSTGAKRKLEQYPASLAAYYNNGEPYAEGDTLRLPDLANTLSRIRDDGRDGFYTGETARLIVEEMQRDGGLITAEDLANYQAKERAGRAGHVPRLRRDLHAAAELRRRGDDRDAQHPRGVRPRAAGPQLPACRAPDRRGDASRLP